jgi:hypothetical protein
MEINWFFAERALKRLSAEDRAKLTDPSSRQRVFFIVTMLVLVVVLFIIRKAWPWSDGIFVWALLVLFVLMAIRGEVLAYVKLKNLSMPKQYVSRFLVSRVVYNSAMFLLLLLGMRYL